LSSVGRPSWRNKSCPHKDRGIAEIRKSVVSYRTGYIKPMGRREKETIAPRRARFRRDEDTNISALLMPCTRVLEASFTSGIDKTLEGTASLPSSFEGSSSSSIVGSEGCHLRMGHRFLRCLWYSEKQPRTSARRGVRMISTKFILKTTASIRRGIFQTKDGSAIWSHSSWWSNAISA